METQTQLERPASWPRDYAMNEIIIKMLSTKYLAEQKNMSEEQLEAVHAVILTANSNTNTETVIDDSQRSTNLHYALVQQDIQTIYVLDNLCLQFIKELIFYSKIGQIDPSSAPNKSAPKSQTSSTTYFKLQGPNRENSRVSKNVRQIQLQLQASVSPHHSLFGVDSLQSKTRKSLLKPDALGNAPIHRFSDLGPIQPLISRTPPGSEAPAEASVDPKIPEHSLCETSVPCKSDLEDAEPLLREQKQGEGNELPGSTPIFNPKKSRIPRPISTRISQRKWTRNSASNPTPSTCTRPVILRLRQMNLKANPRVEVDDAEQPLREQIQEEQMEPQLQDIVSPDQPLVNVDSLQSKVQPLFLDSDVLESVSRCTSILDFSPVRSPASRTLTDSEAPAEAPADLQIPVQSHSEPDVPGSPNQDDPGQHLREQKQKRQTELWLQATVSPDEPLVGVYSLQSRVRTSFLNSDFLRNTPLDPIMGLRPLKSPTSRTSTDSEAPAEARAAPQISEQSLSGPGLLGNPKPEDAKQPSWEQEQEEENEPPASNSISRSTKSQIPIPIFPHISRRKWFHTFASTFTPPAFLGTRSRIPRPKQARGRRPEGRSFTCE